MSKEIRVILSDGMYNSFLKFSKKNWYDQKPAKSAAFVLGEVAEGRWGPAGASLIKPSAKSAKPKTLEETAKERGWGIAIPWGSTGDICYNFHNQEIFEKQIEKIREICIECGFDEYKTEELIQSFMNEDNEIRMNAVMEFQEADKVRRELRRKPLPVWVPHDENHLSGSDPEECWQRGGNKCKDCEKKLIEMGIDPVSLPAWE